MLLQLVLIQILYLNVGQGVNLYATEITTAGVNTGSFNFNGGGTSIVSGTVGTDANKFNSITLTNNTTVKFTDDVISNGTTTIGGNSTLQIANDYIADSIQGNAAGDTGTLQFVNTKGILVALKGNPNPDNALAALQVSGSADVAINGIVNVNGEISLGVNVLGFTDGTSTWGNDTTISTTLTSDEVMGNIVISGAAEVKVAGLKTIKVQDNASIDFIGTRAYTLIQGKISAVNDDIDPNVVGTNRYVIYGLIDNNETLVTRTIDIDNIENILNNDISGNGNPVIRHNLVTFLNTNNTGNAEQAYNNILLAQNTNDAATSFAATLTDTSTSVNNININVAKEEQGLIGYRLDELRYLCTPESDKMASSEGGVAAGDEPIDNVAYGVWFKPLYVDTHQSEKGGVAGYKARTVGTVIGLDTLANDNLMIGAAIGLAKTDVKHQNYKRGDKTTIDSLSFSLYGAQQLVANFFIHGNAIFSVNQVKNRSQRYVFDKNGNRNTQIASANYSNMTFGGNFMVGYDASLMDGLLVTPMAGLSYLKSSDESYKESGTTFANRQVYSKFSDRTDFIGGAKLMGYTMNLADLIVYPEAHAFVIQKIGGRLSKTQYQLEGQVNPYITPSDKTARTTYNLGLSGTIRPDTKMEYGIGYDLNIAKKFISHQGTLKVRLNF